MSCMFSLKQFHAMQLTAELNEKNDQSSAVSTRNYCNKNIKLFTYRECWNCGGKIIFMGLQIVLD